MLFVLFADLWDFAKQTHSLDQKVVKIERVVSVKPLFVGFINPRFYRADL